MNIGTQHTGKKNPKLNKIFSKQTNKRGKLRVRKQLRPAFIIKKAEQIPSSSKVEDAIKRIIQTSKAKQKRQANEASCFLNPRSVANRSSASRRNNVAEVVSPELVSRNFGGYGHREHIGPYRPHTRRPLGPSLRREGWRNEPSGARRLDSLARQPSRPKRTIGA